MKTLRLAVAAATCALVVIAAEVPAHAGAPPRLAFTSEARSLHVVAADGSSERTVAEIAGSGLVIGAGYLQGPAWSPDGRRLAFARTDWAPFQTVTSQLNVVEADGTGSRTVLSVPLAGSIISPVWSPDGRRLAFVLFTWNAPVGAVTWSSIGSRADLYVVNVDGTGLRLVAPLHPSMNLDPTWSPDGARLAFAGDAGGVSAVYSVRMDGPALPRRLSPVTVAASSPRWSRDGKRVAFLAQPLESLLQAPRVWVAEAGTGRARAVGGETYQPPSWSPDGRWLAIASAAAGGIRLIRADGGQDRTLTSGHDFNPVWSRHGEIAFVRNQQRGISWSFQLWVTDPDGGRPRQVSSATSVDFNQVWSTS